MIVLLAQNHHHTQRVLCAPDHLRTSKLSSSFSTDHLAIPSPLPLRPISGTPIPSHFGHQTRTTSWLECSPHENLKPHCDFCHWLRALGPPVLATWFAAAFPFCSVFMAARFAPFFDGLGIDKRKLTRPFCVGYSGRCVILIFDSE